MQKRKTHNKSRRGCVNCKKRHVKCDEQGPPCANCVIRKTTSTCFYPKSAKDLARDTIKEISIRPKSDTCKTRGPSVVTVTYRGSSRPEDTSQSVGHRSSQSLSRSLSPSPAAFSSISSNERLLELELMHRWSTRTWAVLYSIPEDQPFLQVVLPRAGLRHGYVMNGIFAITALDLARERSPTEARMYRRAALEYSNKASVDFRSNLSDITADNICYLFYFAMISAFFNFAMPPLPTETLTCTDRITIAFDMILGASRIAWTNFDWMIQGPDSTSIVMERYTVDLSLVNDIDGDTMIALNHLSTVVRELRQPGPDGTPGKGPIANELWEYQLAVGQTKYCFAEERLNRLKCYYLSLITVAGVDFATRLRAREPMALFIIMYWAVLLHRANDDPMVWWSTAWMSKSTVGHDLVAETSEALIHSPIAQIPEGRKGIAWTRDQVGLPPLEGFDLYEKPTTLEMEMVFGEESLADAKLIEA
ncbi:hypothetical protein D7B24_007161 [Verticillium nonalfalfae]|uniref:Zn(2)-C6 fungal-type domain-containing protein n=1 Tax=Verticillium nonalfalfae TaxID=1051616 RepID=A0A3M9Y9W7_9PEZI|nr:uncharacterized protein D7B24_007161 [Verticillium nonalfalfae]RNJ56556.1 hypothetical protein D7B24_007161 [Verticillium nonalfalfae]